MTQLCVCSFHFICCIDAKTACFQRARVSRGRCQFAIRCGKRVTKWEFFQGCTSIKADQSQRLRSRNSSPTFATGAFITLRLRATGSNEIGNSVASFLFSFEEVNKTHDLSSLSHWLIKKKKESKEALEPRAARHLLRSDAKPPWADSLRCLQPSHITLIVAAWLHRKAQRTLCMLVMAAERS